MNFRDLLDKIRDLEFEDIFPLHRKDAEVKNLLVNVGIYLGAMIFVILLLVLFSHITVLGVILWIIAIPVMIYSLIGMFADLFKFMKYN
ncbi:hypothetical protein SAMN02910317_02653 [Ruminococcaceae bacterium FB2012]|nr:hypothetical protein SAMN02910317_02653 [Ruminococcaceae bacterium FB2012]